MSPHCQSEHPGCERQTVQVRVPIQPQAGLRHRAHYVQFGRAVEESAGVAVVLKRAERVVVRADPQLK